MFLVPYFPSGVTGWSVSQNLLFIQFTKEQPATFSSCAPNGYVIQIDYAKMSQTHHSYKETELFNQVFLTKHDLQSKLTLINYKVDSMISMYRLVLTNAPGYTGNIPIIVQTIPISDTNLVRLNINVPSTSKHFDNF